MKVLEEKLHMEQQAFNKNALKVCHGLMTVTAASFARVSCVCRRLQRPNLKSPAELKHVTVLEYIMQHF